MERRDPPRQEERQGGGQPPFLYLGSGLLTAPPAPHCMEALVPSLPNESSRCNQTQHPWERPDVGGEGADRANALCLPR